LWQLRLGIDRAGKQLVVRHSATPVLVIDLGTFSVARATSADAALSGTPLPRPLLLGAGGAALAAVAAGLIWTRRRQRQALIRDLDRQSEN
jgi:hypothetical protein